VSLTGSEAVGRAVGAAAGAALKPAVLELGGSDPFVVLADVDLATVASAAAAARTVNNGQSCIAAKRFLVEASIADAFTEALGEAMAALRVGPALDSATDVGPQAREDLRDEVHDQVLRSVAGGATVVTGAAVPDQPGAFYPPTVLSGAGPGVVSFEEEVFGPVASVCAFHSDEEAIALANTSPYGLGSSIWGHDEARLSWLRNRIDAGMVFTNGVVKSDPRLPFGGVKASGYGRELGRHGLYEFCNVQTVWSR
jgi:succinate-semialdehyde dehydrogenase/glutarate-semialdehyde dehydrogenase